MKIILIAYYSLTKTTERIALRIKEGAESAGARVDLHDIRSGKTPDFASYDIIGIGSPVYAFSAPINMMEFISSIPKLSGKSAFVFLLYGTYRGRAFDDISSSLEKKDLSVKRYFTSLGEDRYLGYMKEGYLFSPSHPSSGELEDARRFGISIAGIDISDKEAYENEETHLLYLIERFFMKPFFIRNFYSRSFQVHKDRCIKCGLCAKRCPANNIKIPKDSFPSFGKDCILCLECELCCPKEAIKSPVTRFSKTLMKINVRGALKRGVEYKRVKVERGRIVEE